MGHLKSRELSPGSLSPGSLSPGSLSPGRLHPRTPRAREPMPGQPESDDDDNDCNGAGQNPKHQKLGEEAGTGRPKPENNRSGNKSVDLAKPGSGQIYRPGAKLTIIL